VCLLEVPSRKYVGETRDASDPLAPGPAFGPWGTQGCAGPLSSSLQAAEAAAAAAAAAGDALWESVDMGALGLGEGLSGPAPDTLTKALKRLNEERRARERLAGQLVYMQKGLMGARESARRSALDCVQARRGERAALGSQAALEATIAGLRGEVAAAAAALTAHQQAAQEERDAAAARAAELECVVAALRADVQAAADALAREKEQGASAAAALRQQLQAAEVDRAALAAERDRAVANARTVTGQWRASAAELTSASKLAQTLNEELIAQKVRGP
jgi:hypothetical protein